MKTNGKMAACCGTAALLMASVISAIAQQPVRPAPAQHPAPPPAHLPAQTDVPQQTTATYGDWVVQCAVNNSPSSQPVCDMAQVTQLQGKNLPFSRVSIARPDKGQLVRLIVQVPVNVSFNANVHLQTGDDDPGVVAPFARCTPNGCFADFDIKDDVLKKFRAATGASKLSFADAGGHDISVPLSFNGFSQAYDALAKE
jgi:invasion protein IalB